MLAMKELDVDSPFVAIVASKIASFDPIALDAGSMIISYQLRLANGSERGVVEGLYCSR